MDKSEYPHQGSKEYESIEYDDHYTTYLIGKRDTKTAQVTTSYHEYEKS